MGENQCKKQRTVLGELLALIIDYICSGPFNLFLAVMSKKIIQFA